MAGSKKIYFLSDFHLGIPDFATSLEREKRIIRFLDEIKLDAAEIFLVGDMFDFWYEYKKVAPKGFVRLLGKLGELSDAGIPLHFFVGNHDMWVRDYFQRELNMKIYFQPQEFEFSGKKFLIGHGDGLGPGDEGYKRLKRFFRNPVSKWFFGILPPRWGMGLAHYMSRRSREHTGEAEEVFLGADKEWLLIYSREKLKTKFYNYFIFGHRHLAIDYSLTPGPPSELRSQAALVPQGETQTIYEVARYINLGDWIHYDTYAVFDGEKLELRSYSGKENKIIRNW